MKDKFKGLISLMAIILLLPYVLTTIISGNEVVATNGEEVLAKDNGILVGMIAKEMPIEMEKEALKAMTVIARTNKETLKELSYCSMEELEQMWGVEKFAGNYQYLLDLISETQGEIIKYNNQPIIVPFHHLSAGNTRDGNIVYKSDAYAYLVKTESKWDITSDNYIDVKYFEWEEFISILKAAYPNLESIGMEELQNGQTKDGSDYVLEQRIGSEVISGEKFGQLFGLKSSCYYIDEYEKKVRILTKGVGDGVGMSIYGANQMAKEGYSYRDIINYYYKGVSISAQIIE